MSSKNSPTRDRILKSTWKLLEQEGTGKVRMSDIARAAKVSRQAVYLHFENRAELLIATTLYLDEVHEVQAKLAASRNAPTGIARLEEWIDVWGNHIPNIYGVGKALMAMQDTDEEARIAWSNRKQAVREGCVAAVAAVVRDGDLSPAFSETEAVDLLWSLQSVRVWEQLRIECGWSQEQYLTHLKRIVAQILVVPDD